MVEGSENWVILYSPMNNVALLEFLKRDENKRFSRLLCFLCMYINIFSSIPFMDTFSMISKPIYSP